MCMYMYMYVHVFINDNRSSASGQDDICLLPTPLISTSTQSNSPEAAAK